jgi:two-component system alkaline phosphatase synthesis response regulator PhoP
MTARAMESSTNVVSHRLSHRRTGVTLRVCVVTSNLVMSDNLLDALEREGISYFLTEDYVRSLSSESERPDVVLVDFRKAEMDRPRALLEECLEQRLPAIAGLTKEQLGIHDLIRGFDDFILLPARPGELSYRLSRLGGGGKAIESHVIRVGDILIDPKRYEVLLSGRKVFLTYKEYQLLLLLATSPGQVFTRDFLLNRIWGYDYFGGTRTVDVHIRRLRSKIEDADHTFVETVWNVGYRFRSDV